MQQLEQMYFLRNGHGNRSVVSEGTLQLGQGTTPGSPGYWIVGLIKNFSFRLTYPMIIAKIIAIPNEVTEDQANRTALFVTRPVMYIERPIINASTVDTNPGVLKAGKYGRRYS